MSLNPNYWFICATVAVPLLVAAATQAEGQWRNKQAQAAAHYLGALSYPVYCIHIPVFSLFSTLFAEAENRTLTMFTGIGAGLALAHMIYVFIEKPLLRRRAGRRGSKEGA